MQTPPSVPVVISGLGLCTALGDSVSSTWQALLAGRLITDHWRVPLNLPQPRVNSLARRVALEACGNAGWNRDQLRSAALIVGTSKGPVEAWLERMTEMAAVTAPSNFLSSTSTYVASELEMETGPRLTISTACASGLHALIRAVMLLRESRVDRALVVAAESSLHPLFIGSFRRLGVLAPPELGCRPFDRDRAGFLVSEGAAAVCLERAAKPGIQIDRFAIGGDGSHLTHGDPTGRTLRRLLAEVLGDRPIDLIHAHATGTKTNDSLELAAIQSVLATGDVNFPPALYSHKGALGHSLGAAGLVAVVLNCLCHAESRIPPNLQSKRPLTMDRVEFSQTVSVRSIKRSIAVAAGFGGPVAVVSLIG
ncbi:MAG TPA: beta-ketoacyl synthase N-terminal-like domain-containing protein [Tepidisphaeraceae bacterium]|nr:beta-ketoacyl synthase N-terminal-like domain-containing protein [Tepidisphaeraceae bacterium]